MNQETIRIATKVIIHAGNARSQINRALSAAEKFQFSESRDFLVQAEEEINLAHQSQTKTIQKEARGENIEYTLLYTHAQDTLTSAIIEYNLTNHLITMYQRFYNHLEDMKLKMGVE